MTKVVMYSFPNHMLICCENNIDHNRFITYFRAIGLNVWLDDYEYESKTVKAIYTDSEGATLALLKFEDDIDMYDKMHVWFKTYMSRRSFK